MKLFALLLVVLLGGGGGLTALLGEQQPVTSNQQQASGGADWAELLSGLGGGSVSTGWQSEHRTAGPLSSRWFT